MAKIIINNQPKMTKFLVEGGHALNGEVSVSGSKNSALPILCSALLTKEKCIYRNVPNIKDIHSILSIIESIGADVDFENNTVTIEARNLKEIDFPEDTVSKMRASILLLGALINRYKEVVMPFPGGCVLGKRSISAHIYGFLDLGAKIIESSDNIHLVADKLIGRKVILEEQSVTATENIIMASILAEGETEIRMCATEPHIQDLCHCLNKMGAKITGIGSCSLKIQGVQELKGVDYEIQGDYLETGTLASATVATRGDVTIKGINTDYLDSFWQKFKELGVDFELDQFQVRIKPWKTLNPISKLRTAVYPSFATDLQAPFTVLLTQASGISKVFETLFEGRLSYLFELEQMGAKVEYLNPYQALIIGPSKLKGRPISSYDIRAGAAMVIASLMAEGVTEISNIKYIDRGYENLETKLQNLGAKISRLESPINTGREHKSSLEKTEKEVLVSK